MNAVFTTFLFSLYLASSAFAHRYGTDERVSMTKTSDPWGAIGKIEKTGCTATLVYRNLAVTTASCVLEQGVRPAKLKDIGYFLGRIVDGEAREKTWIKRAWWGTDDWVKFPTENWAILLLQDNIGDKLGWMGSSVVPWTDVNMAAFDSVWEAGKTAAVDFECKITGRSGMGLFHNCQSGTTLGGALFFFTTETTADIVGISAGHKKVQGREESQHFKHYDNSVANFAVSVRSFLPKLSELIKEQKEKASSD